MNIELIIFLLIASSSVISWIFKKMKEQAEIRQQQQRVELQNREALRTGQPVSQGSMSGASEDQATARSASASPEERLRELMIERQRRVEELRRRQAQAQAQVQTQNQGNSRQTPRPQVPTPRPQVRPQARPAAGPRPGQGGDNLIVIGPDGKPRLVKRPTQGAQQAAQRQSQQAAQRQSQQAAHQMGQHPARSGQRGGIDRAGQEARVLEQRRRQAIALQQERQAYEDAERDRLAREASERERVSVVAARRTGTIGMGTKGIFDARGLSRDELRQAIVLNEVLAPPVALRQP